MNGAPISSPICARFDDVFGRKELRTQARKYLRGLLSPVPRKNGWQLADAMGDTVPDPTQRLLYRTLWSADSARNILQKYIVEVFADEDGIGVVDETGFIKKGLRSVGVNRHATRSDPTGKIENCQLRTFLSYATGKGHVSWTAACTCLKSGATMPSAGRKPMCRRT
jgi:SRSO17 transposase